MPIATNLTWETATDLGTLPAAVTQNVWDGVSSSQTVWYKYTASNQYDQISVFGWGGAAWTDYQPQANCYTISGGTPVGYPAANPVDDPVNVPFQIPVTAGTTYYFKFTPNADYNPSLLTLSAKGHQAENVPVGAILVNDDTDGYSGVFVSSQDGDDYNVLAYTTPFTAGEYGDVVASTPPRYLFEDRVAGELVLMDETFATLSTITFGHGTGHCNIIRAQQATGKFWIGRRDYLTAPVITSVTSGGVQGATITLPSVGLSALAVDNAETYIYLSGYGALANSNIKRWSIAGAAFTSDLVATLADYTVRDMLMLGDNTLVVLYLKDGVDLLAKRYNISTGATLNTYSLASSDLVLLTWIQFGYRLSYALDDPSSFWVWYPLKDGTQVTGGVSRFRRIRVSDGTVLQSVDHAQYEVGVYMGDQSATPLARFGTSQSCPFVIVRSAQIVPTTGFNAQTRQIRWLRRFPHLCEEQTRMFHKRLQLDMNVGNGLREGQGVNPQVMLRWSDDGGFTFGNEHWASSGPRGNYKQRVQWYRLGMARDRVYEVSGSDPVPTAIVNGYIDVEAGTS